MTPSDGDSHSLTRLEGEAHGLAERLPDLLIEAKRISPDGGARHPRPPPRRAGRDVLAVPPVSKAPTRTADRLAPLGAAPITCTCASANGKRRTPSGCGPIFPPRWTSRAISSTVTKRDRAVVLMLAVGRTAGARRRTRRPARPDAADRQPQGRDASRRGHRRQRLVAPDRPRACHRRSSIPRLAGVMLVGDFLDPCPRSRAHRAARRRSA